MGTRGGVYHMYLFFKGGLKQFADDIESESETLDIPTKGMSQAEINEVDAESRRLANQDFQRFSQVYNQEDFGLAGAQVRDVKRLSTKLDANMVNMASLGVKGVK